MLAQSVKNAIRRKARAKTSGLGGAALLGGVGLASLGGLAYALHSRKPESGNVGRTPSLIPGQEYVVASDGSKYGREVFSRDEWAANPRSSTNNPFVDYITTTAQEGEDYGDLLQSPRLPEYRPVEGGPIAPGGAWRQVGGTSLPY